MNNPPNRARRIAFMLSGGILLLIGFVRLPIDVAQHGVQNWHVLLLGVVMFILGVATFAYDLSQLEE